MIQVPPTGNGFRRKRVVVDAYVPYIKPLMQIAAVGTVSPEAITREVVKDADALIIRTRTKCNADLLEGSRVKFIATATIGTDHIDLPWCKEHGITVANAPGCNAPAVAQYVFSTLMRVINRPLSSYTLGIVGVGHVGRIVEQWARGMHMRVLVCDPPRQRAEGGDGWSSLDEIAAEADIITFHTPLTRTGEDATYHLADRRFFDSLRRAPIIINAARGPIADTAAWIDAIDRGIVGPAIIDCWEGEPNINRDLLHRAAIATPHIAGYSDAGKRRATRMAVDAFSECFDLPHIEVGGDIPPVARYITPAVAYRGYDPTVDDAALRAAPDTFEHLRDTYHLRPELPEKRPR